MVDVTRSAQSGTLSGRKKTATITPGAIANATTVDVDFALPGAKVGDTVGVGFPAVGLVAGILYAGAWVSAADNVKLRFSNITGAPVTQTAISTTVKVDA